jgi:hypothetical protein
VLENELRAMFGRRLKYHWTISRISLHFDWARQRFSAFALSWRNRMFRAILIGLELFQLCSVGTPRLDDIPDHWPVRTLPERTPVTRTTTDLSAQSLNNRLGRVHLLFFDL